MKHITGPICLGEKWWASIYHDWDFPPSLVEEWEALADEYGSPGVFLTPGWFEQWWTAFGRPGRLFVVIMEESGETKAIFPCWTAAASNTNKKGPVASLTNKYSHYYDFLIKAGARPTALSNFARLLRQIMPQSEIVLDYLCSTSGTGGELAASLRLAGFPLHRTIWPHAPFVRVKSLSWDEYFTRLSHNHKNNLKKRRRKADKEGILSFDVVRHSTALDEILMEVFQVESNSWKGKEGTAIKSLPQVESFYRSLARWASSRGHLYLFNLRLDGRLIAFYLCLGCQGTIFLLKTGYDQARLSHLSPGKLLSFEVLRYLFSEPDVRELNFPGPCFPWMMDWASGHGEYERVKIYPRSLAGWCTYGYQYGWKVYLKRFEGVRRIKAWMDEFKR